MLDNVYAFELAYGRRPASWRDFNYGVAHLGRDSARRSIQIASSIAVARSGDKNAWQEWLHEQRGAAGWD